MSEPDIVAAGIALNFQKPTVFEQLTVFENLELALAGNMSFFQTLRARISAAQRERIGEVLEIIGLAGTARVTRRDPRTGRSSGWRLACC